MDRDGHGTHVAGIIAAAGNSGMGVAGVMWKAKIMPLRVIGPDGVHVSDEINAIDYANLHGARIINISLGGYSKCRSLKEEIDASPALFICSAGNYGVSNDQKPQYPSSYSSSNIIAVAATDQNDVLAPRSDYGPTSVQVAAPGINILSTYPPYSPYNDSYNNFTAWDSQGPWHITNDPHVSSLNSAMLSIPSGSIANASITLKDPLDLTSKCGTKLEFDAKLDIVENHSVFYVQASKDGVHWDPIDYDGSKDKYGWIYPTCFLMDYDTSPHLYIRFGLTTDGSAGNNSIYITNVKISVFDPSSAQQNYVLLNGTSMAAPFVSGLAGLVKAIHPNYTSLQIKDAILKGVDVKPSLHGKILTEGRINASKTLSEG
jgi:subtilisin family serine protease